MRAGEYNHTYVSGDRISYGHDGAIAKSAIWTGTQATTTVGLLAILVLRVVEPCNLELANSQIARATTVDRKSEPLSSVSQVSMTASGIGFPLVESTLPSTNMYSPLPSDAIESPLFTVTEDEVDSQHRT